MIITHLRQALQLPANTVCSYDSRRTMYRHHQVIRDFLGVNVFDHRARRVAISAVHRAAQTMDNPADLINVASRNSFASAGNSRLSARSIA